MNNIKTSQIVVAVVLLIVGLFVGKLFFGGSQSTSTQTETTPKPGGITSYDDLGLGPRIQDYQGGEMAAGDNEDFWTNDTGNTVFFDKSVVTTSGTASSSYRLYQFASSSPTVPSGNYYSALTEGNSRIGNALIGGIVIATSTAATSTNSTMASIVGKGAGVIAVPAGWSLITYYQQVDSASCGGVCEPATSTNNGLGKVTWTAHSFATSSNKR